MRGLFSDGLGLATGRRKRRTKRLGAAFIFKVAKPRLR
mgnify:FL=1